MAQLAATGVAGAASEPPRSVTHDRIQRVEARCTATVVATALEQRLQQQRDSRKSIGPQPSREPAADRAPRKRRKSPRRSWRGCCWCHRPTRGTARRSNPAPAASRPRRRAPPPGTSPDRSAPSSGPRAGATRLDQRELDETGRRPRARRLGQKPLRQRLPRPPPPPSHAARRSASAAAAAAGWRWPSGGARQRQRGLHAVQGDLHQPPARSSGRHESRG